MKDFRITHARAFLQVTSAQPIRGFSPASILIGGPKLLQATGILYNDIEVDEFAIVSPVSIIVRIPVSQVGKEFRSLSVFAAADVDSRSVLSLAVARNKSIQGMDRLIQSWLMILYTTPGSSVFSKGSGGGIRALIGSVQSAKNPGVAADLAQAIERTNSELTKLQSRRTIPLEEKLLTATLEGVNFDSSTGTAYAKVSLQNAAGKNAQVMVR